MEENNKVAFIFDWISSWQSKNFALGINIAYSPQYKLEEGYAYSDLGEQEVGVIIDCREFYIALHLGFWQLFMGFRVR